MSKETASKRLDRRDRVTLKDVAAIVGVSPSTVSRVLNGSDSDLISDRTREAVLKVAQELGYTPNPIASALRGHKSYLLGLIVREIDDPFFSSLIADLSAQARELNYNIVLGHAESDPQTALEVSNVLDTRHTDGVFVLGDLHDDESALQEILQGNRAVVALCRGPSPASLFAVNVDNIAGTELVLKHLWDFGHRRIGFIDGGWLGDIRERRGAYQQFLRRHGITIGRDWIQTESTSAEGGYRAMQRLIDLPEPPTAVFASDDVMAIGALKCIADSGLRVPDDFSIVGFDDIELARFFCPALTTVQQPIQALNQQALSLMLSLIDGEEVDDLDPVVRIPPKLIVRQSTGPVRGALKET